jgi:hypothetical protein
VPGKPAGLQRYFLGQLTLTALGWQMCGLSPPGAREAAEDSSSSAQIGSCGVWQRAGLVG